MVDIQRLDPGVIYLLGCDAGSWIAEPIPTDGFAVQAAVRAARLVSAGNAAAAMEVLRQAVGERARRA
jgi:hypothetical protein